MAADILSSLRPADGSAASISAALERSRAALAEAEQAETAAKQARDAALLDFEPKALAALERRLIEARETVERIGAVLALLESRLSTATRTEVVAEAEAARLAYEAAVRALAEWWAEHRPELAAILREGEQLDTAIDGAMWRYNAAKTRAVTAYPDVVLSPPNGVQTAAFGFRGDVAAMMEPPPRVVQFAPLTEQELDVAERRRQIEAEAAANPGCAGLLGGSRSYGIGFGR